MDTPRTFEFVSVEIPTGGTSDFPVDFFVTREMAEQAYTGVWNHEKMIWERAKLDDDNCVMVPMKRMTQNEIEICEIQAAAILKHHKFRIDQLVNPFDADDNEVCGFAMLGLKLR